LNERLVGLVAVGGAAVAIGGVLLVLMPESASGTLRLVLLAAAGAAALYALAALVPEGSVAGWWASPFDPPEGQPRSVSTAGEAVRIRSRLAARRQPLAGAPPLPIETLRLLKPLIEVALVRAGMDPADEGQRRSARPVLAPLTWAVLESEPWKPPKRAWAARADERQVADLVLRVLDDLERLEQGAVPRAVPPDLATHLER
jgi:hypothetical protein